MKTKIKINMRQIVTGDEADYIAEHATRLAKMHSCYFYTIIDGFTGSRIAAQVDPVLFQVTTTDVTLRLITERDAEGTSGKLYSLEIYDEIPTGKLTDEGIRRLRWYGYTPGEHALSRHTFNPNLSVWTG